jgi:large subunit ribosomal protein L26e
MSSHLAKDLRTKHLVRSLPIRKGDEVVVMRGQHKGAAGKVITVYRKRWYINIERVTRDKNNGQTVPVPIHPSNVQITKIKMNKDRKNLLDRKARGLKAGKGEKWTQKELASVD